MNSRLRSSSLRGFRAREDVNPLEGVVNIVDAMLVFACGLMLSLIINWNVDVGNQDKAQLNKGPDVSSVQTVGQDINKSPTDANAYEKMGTVYKDPKTGKLYMVSDK